MLANTHTIIIQGRKLMYSLQQQYNLVPGNYTKEIASVSAYTRKGVSALLQGGRQLLRKRAGSSKKI